MPVILSLFVSRQLESGNKSGVATSAMGQKQKQSSKGERLERNRLGDDGQEEPSSPASLPTKGWIFCLWLLLVPGKLVLRWTVSPHFLHGLTVAVLGMEARAS